MALSIAISLSYKNEEYDLTFGKSNLVRAEESKEKKTKQDLYKEI